MKALNRDVQPFAVVICMFVGSNCRDVFSNGNCDSSLSRLSRLLSRCVGAEELPLRIVPADSFGFELREACFLHHDSLDVLCQRVMQNIAMEVEWGLFFKKKCYLERKWIIRKNVYQEEVTINCSSKNGRLRKVQLIHIGKVVFLERPDFWEMKSKLGRERFMQMQCVIRLALCSHTVLVWE